MSIADTVEEVGFAPPSRPLIDLRMLELCCWTVGLGFAVAAAAQVLTQLIALITNHSFYHRLSLESTSPAGNDLGAWVLLPPLIGAFIVGLMARFGSPAIRGHGIPEAMEQVLTNESRIPARMT